MAPDNPAQRTLCALRMRVLVFCMVFVGAFPLSPQVAPQSVQRTSGAIARFGLPAGFQYQYVEASDTLFLLEPERRQLVVFVWGPGDTAEAVADLLAELGAAAYASQVTSATIAGLRGSEVRIDTGGGAKDRIVALAFDGMLLGFWGKTAGDYPDLDQPMTTIVGSLSLAPATHPPNVVGTYQTRSSASTDWRGDGLFSQEYVTLYANGSAERSSNIGGQVGDVGVARGARTGGMRWEVRGKRLLLYGDGHFLNYGLQAFSNGLELVDQDGRQHLWVRQ